MNDGGIFDEPDSGSHDADLPPVEPVIATPINKSKKQLVCVADQTGNPLVAKAAYDGNGEMQLLEAYRRPTQQEWQHLSQTGQVVKQGNVVRTNTAVGQTEPSTGWGKPAKIAAAVLGLGAVVGGGFLLIKKARNKNPAEQNPEDFEPFEDDADDDDDGDDGEED